MSDKPLAILFSEYGELRIRDKESFEAAHKILCEIQEKYDWETIVVWGIDGSGMSNKALALGG